MREKRDTKEQFPNKSLSDDSPVRTPEQKKVSLLCTTAVEEYFEVSTIVVYRCSTEAGYPLISITESVAQALGYSPEEIIKDPEFWTAHVHPEDIGRILTSMNALAVAVPSVHEYRFMHKDGRYRWLRDERVKVQDDNGSTMVGSWVDITLLRQREEEITHQIYHDSLTGLPNRRFFIERLSVALTPAQRLTLMLAVLYIDLDRFKVVNDSFAYVVGDQLIRKIAHALKEIIREDDVAVRIGSDEFAILLPLISRIEDASRAAQKILQMLTQRWIVDHHEVHLTASIGISVFPNDGKDPEALLRNADNAMHHAKEQGRNNYQFYNKSLNVEAFQRMVLENNLRYAMQKGELIIYYQPQISLETGRIAGMEALIRWNHPELGLLAPSQFIEMAEEAGLIIPVSEWALRTVCAQYKSWIETGSLDGISVTVNLSAHQFKEKNLVPLVKDILRETALDPAFLNLEITEGVAMQDTELTFSRLHQLNDMGIHFVIDDFGTGYSSLSYLKKLPVKAIKIDQSFIRDLISNPDDPAIVQAIITVAHSLKMKTIAEGVETREQCELLRDMQCDEFQGYLFSEPVPADEMERMLRKGRSTWEH